MKKQDIRKFYTQKVTELLNQGYTIFPDTMGGSQGEIAHIDLTNGSEILRVLLVRELMLEYIDKGFYGNAVILTVGSAAADSQIGAHWNGTIWNNKLEPRFQIKWAEINGYGDGWYTDLDDVARIGDIRRERWRRRQVEHRRELTGDAYKSAALKYVRRQRGMKNCKLAEITKVERFNATTRGEILPNLCRYEITARGKTFSLNAPRMDH